MQSKPVRPIGVTILGVLMILAGLFDFFQGAGILMSTDPLESGLGAFAVLLGLAYIPTGIGFLQGNRHAWIPGLVFSILNLVRTFIIALQQGLLLALPGIIVALIIIYYLTTPTVEAYFGRGKKPEAALEKASQP